MGSIWMVVGVLVFGQLLRSLDLPNMGMTLVDSIGGVALFPKKNRHSDLVPSIWAKPGRGAGGRPPASCIVAGRLLQRSCDGGDWTGKLCRPLVALHRMTRPPRYRCDSSGLPRGAMR